MTGGVRSVPLPFSLNLNMNMDHGGHRENGRNKPEHYKAVHNQWMMHQHQMKDHQPMKIMGIMAERDSAIQERNLALSEKKVALAERDMAMLQRDAAVAERNNAIAERDNAISDLHFARQAMNRSEAHHPSPHHLPDSSYDHLRGMHITEAFPISASSDGITDARKPKQRSKKVTRTTKKGKSVRDEDSNQVEDWNRRPVKRKRRERKGQDLSLNQVDFDDSTMPVPGCSCTGRFRGCYKWGSGGWQSSCCTTKISAYPLPMMPNRPKTRFGGRKMSGSAFSKLLTRLAAEGWDLSLPVDLRDQWAGHGSNRYIRK